MSQQREFQGRVTLPEGVVVLRAGDGGPSLFCISPTGGAEGWRGLVQGLPAHITVIGLDSEHVAIDTLVVESVEEQAQRFIGLLKRAQSAGPYRLVGFSFGAHVAFEMARRLVDGGEHVAYLGIIDTWPAGVDSNPVLRRLRRVADLAGKVPRRAAMAFRARRQVARGVVLLARNVLGLAAPDSPKMTAGDCLEAILLDMHRCGKRGGELVQSPVSEGPESNPGSAAIKMRVTRKVAADKRAITAYRMAPLAARISLLASTFERSARALHSLEHQWSAIALNGLTVRWFDCGHVDLIRAPMVAEVSRAIGEDLSPSGTEP